MTKAKNITATVRKMDSNADETKLIGYEIYIYKVSFLSSYDKWQEV